MGCNVDTAGSTCRLGYHLCNLRDLYSGGYHVARLTLTLTTNPDPYPNPAPNHNPNPTPNPNPNPNPKPPTPNPIPDQVPRRALHGLGDLQLAHMDLGGVQRGRRREHLVGGRRARRDQGWLGAVLCGQ